MMHSIYLQGPISGYYQKSPPLPFETMHHVLRTLNETKVEDGQGLLFRQSCEYSRIRQCRASLLRFCAGELTQIWLLEPEMIVSESNEEALRDSESGPRSQLFNLCLIRIATRVTEKVW